MSYPEQRYLAETGEISGTLRPAENGPDLSMATGTRVHYLGTGGSTNGAFGLYRWEMGPRPGGASPHFHRTITESFYVLTGSVQLYNGATWAKGLPGDFLHVPEGGIHAFRNTSGEPASMLVLFTPGAPREAYFEELADITHTGRELTSEGWVELWNRHDQYPV